MLLWQPTAGGEREREQKPEVGQPLRAEVKTLAFWRFAGHAQRFSWYRRYTEKGTSSLPKMSWSKLDRHESQNEFACGGFRIFALRISRLYLHRSLLQRTWRVYRNIHVIFFASVSLPSVGFPLSSLILKGLFSLNLSNLDFLTSRIPQPACLQFREVGFGC